MGIYKPFVSVYYLTSTPIQKEEEMKIEFSPNTPIYIQVMEHIKKKS